MPLANSNPFIYICGTLKGKRQNYVAEKDILRFVTGSPSCPDYINNQNIPKMGTVKNVELSMQNVRRLLERNHLAYTIEEDAILFNRKINRRTQEKTYFYIAFPEGGQKVGRQRIAFGSVQEEMDEEGITLGSCFRSTTCTDMAFFAFHFHDLFPNFYKVDEYNDWN